MQALYEELVELGVLGSTEADRLAIFGFAEHVRRLHKSCRVKNPCGFFNARLRKPDQYGRTWREAPSQADEDAARAAIRRLDHPPRYAPEGATREPDAADDPSRLGDLLTILAQGQSP